MKKKISDKEIVEVLTVMSDSAKKVLKNVKKKDTLPSDETERLLGELKVRYPEAVAAE